jgi:NAD(P)H-hydrate epimerase
VLVVAGSRGMAGAAVLAGQGALRAGAGLVRIATPAEVFPAVAGQVACCLTQPLAQTPAGTLALAARRALEGLVAANDVVALGPGLGRHRATDFLVRQMVRETAKPLVLDADGLNAVAGAVEELHDARGPRVLTPHPGEMARLCGAGDTAVVQHDRVGVARRFAREHRCVVVLKGHRTVVTDGDRVCVNMTGNPGMATGGTGDVLTGVIAALIGQGLTPLDAAQLGAHVHGLAGDLAADRMGETSLVASDLLDYLPAAFLALRPPSATPAE